MLNSGFAVATGPCGTQQALCQLVRVVSNIQATAPTRPTPHQFGATSGLEQQSYQDVDTEAAAWLRENIAARPSDTRQAGASPSSPAAKRKRPSRRSRRLHRSSSESTMPLHKGAKHPSPARFVKACLVPLCCHFEVMPPETQKTAGRCCSHRPYNTRCATAHQQLP